MSLNSGNFYEMKSKNQKKAPLIILASGSASRRQQLEDLGFNFKVEVSGIDEDIYKQSPSKDSNDKIPSVSSPSGQALVLNHRMGQIAQKIAQAKVEKVALKYPKALVLGGDQMACLGQQIFNKPLSSKSAVRSLKALQGKTHILFTALHVRYGKKSFSHLEINKMSMRALSEGQIRAYVKRAKPLGCAGAYALERYGIGLFEKIETKDQSAVIGFPLIALLNQMARWQIPLPFLTDLIK